MDWIIPHLSFFIFVFDLFSYMNARATSHVTCIYIIMDLYYFFQLQGGCRLVNITHTDVVHNGYKNVTKYVSIYMYVCLFVCFSFFLSCLKLKFIVLNFIKFYNSFAVQTQRNRFYSQNHTRQRIKLEIGMYNLSSARVQCAKTKEELVWDLLKTDIESKTALLRAT